MIDYLFPLLILILGVFMVFVICNTACEYRNYSTGHRYIKAFEAQSSFQRSFTVLHKSSDINKWDFGKITYVGYVVAVICTVTGIIVIPISPVMCFFNPEIAMRAFFYWFIGCSSLGIAAFLIQIFDSLFNFLLEIFNR